MYGILPRQLFFVATVVYSRLWDFLCGGCKHLFVSQVNKTVFEWPVLHNSLLHLLVKHRDFLNTDISQGRVATCLGRGGVLLQISY